MRKKKIPILRLNYSKNEKRYISKGVNAILTSGHLTMSKKVFQFENVQVNDENHDIKNNRLELLKMFCNTFDKFINFSKLEGF